LGKRARFTPEQGDRPVGLSVKQTARGRNSFLCVPRAFNSSSRAGRAASLSGNAAGLTTPFGLVEFKTAAPPLELANPFVWSKCQLDGLTAVARFNMLK
jgi:hypothetical protein